jgi:replicative DNA helicase
LERKGLTLSTVIVDHIGHVRASDRYRGNRVAEVTEISAGLKALAKELDVGVLALCQLNRQLENRDDKRPQLSDLRDSGALEQDADAVLFVFREAYYLERLTCEDPDENGKRVARLYEVQNRLEVILAKQRNGPIGTVELFCDVAANAARDLARHA